MKINQISNTQSFGALMVERKKATPKQIKIMKAIKDTIKKDAYYNILLESRYSDIYMSPNKDKHSVDLKLLTAAGLTYSFIPQDDRGEIKTNIHLPEVCFIEKNKERLQNNVAMRTRKFVCRALNGILDDFDSNVNQAKLQRLEKISASDLANNKISRPDLIQDAVCLYGSPQVETQKH